MSACFDAFTDFIAVFPNGNLTYFTQCITKVSNSEINKFVEYTYYLLINNLLYFSNPNEYLKYCELISCLKSEFDRRCKFKSEFDRRCKPQLSSDAEEYVPSSLTNKVVPSILTNKVVPSSLTNKVVPLPLSLNNNSANILQYTSNHNILKRKNKKIKK